MGDVSEVFRMKLYLAKKGNIIKAYEKETWKIYIIINIYRNKKAIYMETDYSY